jgi:hypothetical protein
MNEKRIRRPIQVWWTDPLGGPDDPGGRAVSVGLLGEIGQEFTVIFQTQWLDSGVCQGSFTIQNEWIGHGLWLDNGEEVEWPWEEKASPSSDG